MRKVTIRTLITSIGIITPLIATGCSRDPSSLNTPASDSTRDISQEADAIVADYCSGCHAPPRSQSHAPAEWPAVVARMQEHRSRAGMSPIPAEKLHKITSYLQQSGGNS